MNDADITGSTSSDRSSTKNCRPSLASDDFCCIRTSCNTCDFLMQLLFEITAEVLDRLVADFIFQKGSVVLASKAVAVTVKHKNGVDFGE
jgi:hypothetical protein